MVVLRETHCKGTEFFDSFVGAPNVRIVAGAAVAFGTKTAGAETLTPACSESSIVGFVDGPRSWNPKGSYDHFYYNEMLSICQRRAVALVVPNGADVNIDAGDFLEVAALGNGSVPHGLLEEAGSALGTAFTNASVAKAARAVSMGSGAYKVPASNVAVGAEVITMAAADLLAMDIEDGNLILMEDLDGSLQINKVASVSSTEIGLVIPSTVALTIANSDLVTKIFQVEVEQIK